MKYGLKNLGFNKLRFNSLHSQQSFFNLWIQHPLNSRNLNSTILNSTTLGFYTLEFNNTLMQQPLIQQSYDFFFFLFNFIPQSMVSTILNSTTLKFVVDFLYIYLLPDPRKSRAALQLLIQ